MSLPLAAAAAPARAASAALSRPTRLKPGVEAQPLFVLGGAGADLGELADLVARLTDPRAVWAIPFWSPAEAGPPPRTVEAMADRAVTLILARQPRGPYHLLGYSLGGLVALEAAHRLRERGEDVGWLGLIDAVFDRRHWPLATRWLSRARRALRRLKGPPTPPRPVAAAPGAAGETAKDLCMAASRAYAPRPYPGAVAFFTAENQSTFACDVARLWRGRIGDLETIIAPGDHLGLVHAPDSVAVLGALIDSRLSRLATPAAPVDPGPGPGDAPKVLVATSLRWFSSARFALTLAQAGFAVEALCPPGHAIERTGVARRVHRIGATDPMGALRRAIDASDPWLLAPVDDQIVDLLHRLHLRAGRATPPDLALRALIERSLGAGRAYADIYSRARIAAVARALDLPTPETFAVADAAALNARLDQIGFPAVLKTDGSWGGEGCAIVRDRSEAERAFRRLSAPPGLTRAVKRLVRRGDIRAFGRWAARTRPTVSLQRYVPGRPANAAVSCWRGEVLSVVCVEAVRTANPTGPATVVRRLDHADMERAVERLVRRLGLSGFCGLDFILGEDGRAWLLEINPRATQTCHLADSGGLDPATALHVRLTGRPRPAAAPAPGGEVVALFPQELARDPHSPFLGAARHDLPDGYPEFVRLGLAAARRRRGRGEA